MSDIQRDERMAWTGTCEKCLAIYTVAPHWETNDDDREAIEKGPDTWDSFTSCFVCDSYIDWLGSDPIGQVLRHV